MKTLLIVSAGSESIAGIQRAKAMGLHVVASDGNPNAPGLAYADDVLLASTYDVEATVAAATTYHRETRSINGVMCLASDVPLTVASVAKELGLIGIETESARLATDKLAMKQRFAQDGVSIPWFSSVRSVDHLKVIVSEQQLPLVIKPVDSRGSRGVMRLLPDCDVDSAFAKAKSHSPTGRVMIEHFLDGPQVSTESLVINGIAYTPGFADRNYELIHRYSPHIIENGGQLPSQLTESTKDCVRNLVQLAATSLGIHNGVVKGDIVVTNGVPTVIELAARLSGGYFCTHQIPLSTGVDLVANAIRQALSVPVDVFDLEPKYQRPVAQRYWFPEPGLVTEIKGVETYNDHPDVAYFELRVKPGDVVGPIDSHPARAGVVITTGTSLANAVALANEIVETIKIVTTPL